MSFQYASALEVMSICREVAPGAKIVLGGYHASLVYIRHGVRSRCTCCRGRSDRPAAR
jgi:hypothetical protein